MTIEIEILILIAAVLVAISVGIGYWWASASQKRAAGGKTVTELTAEKEAYEEQVVEHFKTTADLLNEMTDKYRDVYRHMAEGAQNLAPVDSAAPALAALQNGLLTAPADTHENEAVIESESAEVSPTTEQDQSPDEPVAEPTMEELPNDELSGGSDAEVESPEEQSDLPADVPPSEAVSDGETEPAAEDEFFSSSAKAHAAKSENNEPAQGTLS